MVSCSKEQRSLLCLGFAILCLLPLCPAASAVPVSIRVSESSGAPLKDALVILQSLDPDLHEHEISRVLTTSDGTVAGLALNPGLYRAIATYPYGPWRVAVREFLVKAEPVAIDLRMANRGTDDAMIIGTGRLLLHVLDAGGKPVEGADVLLRDAEARPSYERWGKTNAQGTVSLEVTAEADTLVVIFHSQLYTFPANSYDTERTVRLQ